MSSTAVARNCPEVTRDLVARQLNHDPKTSLNHYQATRSDRDAVTAYKTIQSLRLGGASSSVVEADEEESDTVESA